MTPEFQNKTLESMDDRFLRAGESLLGLSPKRVECLAAVIESKELVHWLQSTIKCKLLFNDRHYFTKFEVHQYIYIYIYIYTHTHTNDIITEKRLWKKRCLERESNPRPFGYMHDCDTTTPSRQPRWQQSLSLVLWYTSRGCSHDAHINMLIRLNHGSN